MKEIEKLFEEKYGAIRGAQSRLAEELKTNQSTVASWVSGRNKPSIDLVKKMSKIFKKTEEEIFRIFGMEKRFSSEVNLRQVIPLDGKNTISLPILAGVPAGLPEYSEKDVAYFTSIPRALFPGADFVVECIGDSLEPRILKGDFCVIRKMNEPLHGKPMLVKTENGFCMKVICKEGKKIKLCSVNHGYKPFVPKELEIVGLILGTWSRHDKDNWLHTEGK